jgi:Fur family transcriptional regulator, peroxide stress response regulator
MTSSLEALLDKARTSGIRLTPQRMELLRALSETTQHPTADDLYRHVRRILPSVTPATIHRNLQELVKAGLIATLERTGGSTQYDPTVDDHHHFVCRRCGRIFDVYLSHSENRIDRQRSELGNASIDRFEILFDGTCGDCLTLQ